MNVPSITPVQLEELRGQGEPIELIDVRTPVEFREVHAEPAVSVPLDALDVGAFLRGREGLGDRPIYVICRSGDRARRAVSKFQAEGHRNAINVEGGTLAWERAGLPVVRGEAMISLERQVRIGAGSLVAVGVALGASVHPVFLALPGFVGAGLVFSGVTDTCGMGMILARMPWNRPGGRMAHPAPEGTR